MLSRITPGFGIAIGLAAGGAVVAGGIALHAALDDERSASGGPQPGQLPSPAPGPAPTPPQRDLPEPSPRPVADGMRSVEELTDRYLALYDHSGDEVVDIGWGQHYGKDERVTGEVGDIHTMVEFLREADVDQDDFVTRTELRDAIAGYDTLGIVGFNPDAPEIGDGLLGPSEILAFRAGAISAYSDPVSSIDERGVAQLIEADGKQVHNEAFFDALPDYRALTGAQPR